jgi:hypothetical protein
VILCNSAGILKLSTSIFISVSRRNKYISLVSCRGPNCEFHRSLTWISVFGVRSSPCWQPKFTANNQQSILSSTTTHNAHEYDWRCRLLIAQLNGDHQKLSETRDGDAETTRRLCANNLESEARSATTPSNRAMMANRTEIMGQMDMQTVMRMAVISIHIYRRGRRDMQARHIGLPRVMVALHWYGIGLNVNELMLMHRI